MSKLNTSLLLLLPGAMWGFGNVVQKTVFRNVGP